VSNSRLFFAAALLLTALLFSLGVEVRQSQESAKIVHFSYSDNTPMMYAKVKLYPPSNPTIETVKSLTDKNGFFAFVPDEEGEWRVEAMDGMGHRGEIVVNVSENSLGADDKQNVASASTIFRLILGLSLILNIFAVYGFVLKRYKSAQ
jgi:nickel transport protein